MLKKILLLLSVALFCWRCANEVPPSGGKKDTTPPKVLKSLPANASVNFHGSRIVIFFDEYFTLVNPAKEIFVTPSLAHQPLVKVKNKSLEIKFPDSLKKNTTYTIHFGNAIADVNEGNKLRDFQFVFSTGPVIDSMKISGMVNDALTQKSQKDILVMLYIKTGDSIVSKEKPIYFTHTDESGNFSINHIHDGRYKLFAVNDKDGNLMYNLPDEEIAFADSLIGIHDTSGFYKMRLFKPVADKQKLINAKCISPGVIMLALAKPSSALIILLQPEVNTVMRFNNTRDTAFLYTPIIKQDGLKLFILDAKWKDTVDVSMKNVLRDSSFKKYLKPRFTTNLTSSGKTLTILSIGSDLKLTLNNPVTLVTLPGLVLTDDSTGKISVPVGITEHVLDVIIPVPDVIPGRKYTLKIPAGGLFVNIFGVKNDSLTIHFKAGTREDLGNLHLKVSVLDSSSHYLFRFFSSKNELLKSQKLNSGTNDFIFNNMIAGNYKVMIIDDANDSGDWDTGNYKQHKQPEKIILLRDDISVRANWDVDLELPIGGKQKIKR